MSRKKINEKKEEVKKEKINPKISFEEMTDIEMNELLIELHNTAYMTAIRKYNNYHKASVLSGCMGVNAFKEPERISDYQGVYKGLSHLENYIDMEVKNRKEEFEREQESKKEG